MLASLQKNMDATLTSKQEHQEEREAAMLKGFAEIMQKQLQAMEEKHQLAMQQMQQQLNSMLVDRVTPSNSHMPMQVDRVTPSYSTQMPSHWQAHPTASGSVSDYRVRELNKLEATEAAEVAALEVKRVEEKMERARKIAHLKHIIQSEGSSQM